MNFTGDKKIDFFFKRLAVTTFLLLVFSVSLYAAEVKYPVPSFKGDDLQKVRAWEDIWVGKKINHQNIDQVKEYVTDSYYNILKNPDKWGELWFEIAPYREIIPTKGTIEATLKYAGTPKFGPQDELLNWTSGLPFPEPKTALEVAYNFDSPTHGDNWFNSMVGKMVDGVRKYDRNVQMKTYLMWCSGRTDVPPIPEINPNTREIRRASHGEWIEPQILRGTRNMTIKWKDDLREWGSWSYAAGIRRVIRMSTAQRWDHQGGSDLCLDDQQIYNYAMSNMKYKMLGRKDVLLPRHVDAKKIFNGHKEGQLFDNGIPKERINIYAIEAVHKDPNYLYSKQIWYIDPETWWALYADKYDKSGQLWKVIEMGQEITKLKYTGEALAVLGYTNYCDVIRKHATIGLYPEYEYGATGEYFKPDYYTPQALLKYGY